MPDDVKEEAKAPREKRSKEEAKAARLEHRAKLTEMGFTKIRLTVPVGDAEDFRREAAESRAAYDERKGLERRTVGPERAGSYRVTDKGNGMTIVRVFVPSEEADAFREKAEALRKAARGVEDEDEEQTEAA